jgi:hypothetical protein
MVLSRRDEIRAIAERHGAVNVAIFGSLARGDGGPEADLDLLVDFRAGSSLLDQAALARDLERELGIIPIDVASRNELKPHWRRRILEEAVPL